jgi:hypothetical protein
MKNQRDRIVRLARIAAPILIAATLHSAALAAGVKRADWVGDYSAVAMGTGHVGAAAGRAGRVDINIYRWTTPEERQKILELIATGDGKTIRKGLDDLDFVGRVRFPGQSGYDLIYAWQMEEAGKKRVVVAMNRPLMSTPGATTGNSVDFLVGIAVLDFEGSGEGKGVIAPAVELEIQPDGRIDISESAADPVDLTSVKPR